MPDALLLVNCNGTVVNANAIALEAFETPGTALVGRGLLDLLPEFDSKRIPGSMRRPDQETDPRERQKPTRMVARRTDGAEFPVEVTSANLEDGRTPYASAIDAAFATDHHGAGSGNSYTGDELLMLVVRDLTGTLDTESELARQQRQTEMILRAASEGVVGVDTAGRIVLVNPAAAQILGHRAGDLGGRELHPLVHHTRADGTPLPYEETPLADTLRSGRKHRVRAGQVLWTKSGQGVPVDMTTAPVRDGDQLVGAVLTFTDRRAYEDLTARHEHLRTVLGETLRKPLDQLRDELAGLASDPAGQLWPEANQVLHHLTAGYGRMAALVDNVLAYQQLDAGQEKLRREMTPLDKVVANGVDRAVELIGPGRAQFAVHAPPVEAEVDAERLSTALAHLVADVTGVDALGNTPVQAAQGVDSTIVVAAARRGDVVRIEVRGPHGGGSPVHEPIVRGIVRRHGGVLQTHEVPGAAGGSAYVLEVPVSADGGPGTVGTGAGQPGEDGSRTGGTGSVEYGAQAQQPGAGTDGSGAPVEAPVPGEPGEVPGEGAEAGAAEPVPGATDGAGVAYEAGHDGLPGAHSVERENETTVMPVPAQPVRGTELQAAEGSAAVGTGGAWTSDGTAPQAPEDGADGMMPAAQGEGPGTALAVPGDVSGPESGEAEGQAGAPQQLPAAAVAEAPRPTGRRRGRPSPAEEQHEQALAQDESGARGALALPPAAADARADVPVPAQGTGRRARRALASPAQEGAGDPQAGPVPEQVQPGTGRRGRRPVGNGAEPEPEAAQGGAQLALPAQAGPEDRPVAEPSPQQGRPQLEAPGAQAVPAGVPAQGPEFAAPPGQQQPQQAAPGPHALPAGGETPMLPAQAGPADGPSPEDGAGDAAADGVEAAADAPEGADGAADSGANAPGTPPGAMPLPRELPQEQPQSAGPVPAQDGVPAAEQLPQPEAGEQPVPPGEAQDGGPCVRTLGQGVPFSQRIAEQQQPQQRTEGGGMAVPSTATAIPSTPSTPGSGRRRRLAAPPEEAPDAAGQAPQAPAAAPQPPPGPMPQPQPQGEGPAREFAIGAPAAGSAEGPEPLDGPDSLVEVSDGRGTSVPDGPVDDELPPEPLDNPRRLLVWPEPDVSTQQALAGRGYRPVIVHSREEVDAQIAAYPAALFVDPLTGPITRTALQSLRQAAVAAEVPVLVTAGLGQATREAAYGADPAVLLKALAPRDSEQHPPRVLLVEEHEAVAGALTASLERRGMQVAHAPSDSEAVNVAAEARPNLVVMDLMQIRRRRAGIIDWLRVNGLLNRTPFVVYTSADLDPEQLPRLISGETVLFLAERSTSAEVQSRIVDLLTKIGAH
nr:PAS domain-containing protein [Streptomyces sp. HNM0574]